MKWFKFIFAGVFAIAVSCKEKKTFIVMPQNVATCCSGTIPSRFAISKKSLNIQTDTSITKQ